MKSRAKFDEIKITELLAQGDAGAFTEIYNEYWRTLIALAYSHTKDKFQAEEIVQEVFLSLWNRRNSIKIVSLSSYLGTAVKFAVFKFLHKKINQTDIRERMLKPARVELQEELFDLKFLQDYINGIVEQLPEKCKLVYKLSREKYMPIPEIAHEMGISEKTAEAHLTKALKVLRLNLKEVLTLLFILKHF